MYPDLFQYLLQYKLLPVPGIGTFLVERRPAQVDFPDKKIFPPVFTIALQPAGDLPSRSFIAWLSNRLAVSDRDAIVRFNDFAFDMKKQVDAGDTIDWKGVGVIKKGLGGEIRFIAAETVVVEEPIPAAKVLREKAAHTVRVGEEEKTSEQMEEMLSQPEEKRSFWWTLPLAIGLLALLFTGWYLSKHGLEPTSLNNSKNMIPADPPATYKVLP